MNPLFEYKVVKSKDNKGIYMASDSFNDANAPDTTTSIDDPYVDDEPASDQDLDVNKPPPSEGPSKPTDPSKPSDPSKPTDSTDPSNSSDSGESESSGAGGNNEGSNGKKKSGRLPIGAIIGIVIAIVVVGVGVFVFIYIRRKRSHVSSTEGDMAPEKKEGENAETQKIDIDINNI